MDQLINSFQSLFCGSKASMTTTKEQSITVNLSKQPTPQPREIKVSACHSDKKELLSVDMLSDHHVLKFGKESFTTQASNLFGKYEKDAFKPKDSKMVLLDTDDKLTNKQKKMSIQSRQLETTLKQAQYLLGKPMSQEPSHKNSMLGSEYFNIDSLHHTHDHGVYQTFIGKPEYGSKDISSIQAVSFQNSNQAEQFYSTEDNCQRQNKIITSQYSQTNIMKGMKLEMSKTSLISPSDKSQFTFSPKFFKPTQSVLIENQKNSLNTVKQSKQVIQQKINVHSKSSTLKLKPVVKTQIKNKK